MKKPKIFIFPGNGDSHIETSNWYAWARDELKRMGCEVFADDMPDPILAREIVWLPYMAKVINADPNVILIGHSSGGVAVLRYLEYHQVLGAIIVSVNHTDLGYTEERLSGYYNHPWEWKKINEHAKWIVQFHSKDDPFIPVAEARFVHEKIGSEYHELDDRGHFMPDHNPMNNTFPEIIDVIEKKLT